MTARRHPITAAKRACRSSARTRRRIVEYAMAACLAAWAILPSSYAAQTPGDPYGTFIAEAAQRLDLPASWIRAVMRAESGFDPVAVSDKGAQGLMQIMPGTWDALRAQYDLGDDPFAPRDNIIAGASYLRAMLDRYGSAELMLAAYHAGPGRTDDYVTAGRALPSSTRAYIAAVLPHLTGVANVGTAVDDTTSPSDPTGDRLFVAVTAGSGVSDLPASGANQNNRSSIDERSVDPTGGLFTARDAARETNVDGALISGLAASGDSDGDTPDAGGSAEPPHNVASPVVGTEAPP